MLQATLLVESRARVADPFANGFSTGLHGVDGPSLLERRDCSSRIKVLRRSAPFAVLPSSGKKFLVLGLEN
jgi:hypothetical protein